MRRQESCHYARKETISLASGAIMVTAHRQKALVITTGSMRYKISAYKPVAH